MAELTKKERSSELNGMKRILIDFNTLISTEIILYKLDNVVHYIFDQYGTFIISKHDSFLFIEEFIQNDEYIKLDYNTWKSIVALKKSEVVEISLCPEYVLCGVEIAEERTDFKSPIFKDVKNKMKKIINVMSDENINKNFSEFKYDKDSDRIRSIVPGITYPYKITFSDDINFKLKIDDPDSRFYARPLNSGVFAHVITKTKYGESFTASSSITVFNYLNNKVV